MALPNGGRGGGSGPHRAPGGTRRAPIELPKEESPAGWDARYDPGAHRIPERVLTFEDSPKPQRPRRPPTTPAAEPSPAPGRPRPAATPPCAALQAVVTCFSLHQRASWGRPLNVEEQRVLARIEAALRNADIRSRRRWKRHPTSRGVCLNAMPGPGLPGPLWAEGTMLDLSAGGLRIADASHLLPRGAQVEVCMRVKLAEAERTLVFPSRVTWVDASSRSLGVAFVAPARWSDED